MIIPDPKDVPLEAWAAELVLQDPTIAYLGDDWKRWASTVTEFSTLRTFNLPNPYAFQGWREWASAVRLAVVS